MSETAPDSSDEIGWVKVRIDTKPNADGWCFCTPENHPQDLERGLVTGRWNETSQFFGKAQNRVWVFDGRNPIHSTMSETAATLTDKAVAWDAVAQARKEERAKMAALIEALLWIDHYEPELVSNAEAKFGFDLAKLRS